MCEAQFQPPPAVPVTPAPLAVALLNGIDDAVVIDELKLKDDQVKALVTRRQELWDEAYATAPTKLAETAADRNKATDELLKKTLTPTSTREPANSPRKASSTAASAPRMASQPSA